MTELADKIDSALGLAPNIDNDLKNIAPKPVNRESVEAFYHFLILSSEDNALSDTGKKVTNGAMLRIAFQVWILEGLVCFSNNTVNDTNIYFHRFHISCMRFWGLLPLAVGGYYPGYPRSKLLKATIGSVPSHYIKRSYLLRLERTIWTV